MSNKPKVLYGQHYKIGKNGRKELKPNIAYIAPNGYKYQTDSKGRIVKVEGELKNKTAPRNSYDQRVAGREDRQKGDDGGHLIASIFDGSGDLDNLVAMRANLNRGDWKTMENIWKRSLDKGQKVEVEIKPNYSGNSQRPVSFDVRYKIGKGKWEEENFKN